MTNLYLFDLIGTFAFAFYGAYIAQRKSFDVFGIVITGILSAFGGGVIRDVMLGQLPFVFTNNTYIFTVLIACLSAIIAYRYFDKINRPLQVIDAIGLATFALIGASRAADAHLGVFAIISFATLTAVGGGIIRDIAIRETPLLFSSEFYATPAIIAGALFAIFPNYQTEPAFIYGLLTLTFLIRMWALSAKIHLWKPTHPQGEGTR